MATGVRPWGWEFYTSFINLQNPVLQNRVPRTDALKKQCVRGQLWERCFRGLPLPASDTPFTYPFPPPFVGPLHMPPHPLCPPPCQTSVTPSCTCTLFAPSHPLLTRPSQTLFTPLKARPPRTPPSCPPPKKNGTEHDGTGHGLCDRLAKFGKYLFSFGFNHMVLFLHLKDHRTHTHTQTYTQTPHTHAHRLTHTYSHTHTHTELGSFLQAPTGHRDPETGEEILEDKIKTYYGRSYNINKQQRASVNPLDQATGKAHVFSFVLWKEHLHCVCVCVSMCEWVCVRVCVVSVCMSVCVCVFLWILFLKNRYVKSPAVWGQFWPPSIFTHKVAKPTCNSKDFWRPQIKVDQNPWSSNCLLHRVQRSVLNHVQSSCTHLIRLFFAFFRRFPGGWAEGLRSGFSEPGSFQRWDQDDPAWIRTREAQGIWDCDVPLTHKTCIEFVWKICLGLGCKPIKESWCVVRPGTLVWWIWPHQLVWWIWPHQLVWWIWPHQLVWWIWPHQLVWWI